MSYSMPFNVSNPKDVSNHPPCVSVMMIDVVQQNLVCSIKLIISLALDFSPKGYSSPITDMR